jgi:hypothetical protein
MWEDTLKPSTSTPNLVRIAREPKLYDEAMSRIEQHLETAGYGKHAAPKVKA